MSLIFISPGQVNQYSQSLSRNCFSKRNKDTKNFQQTKVFALGCSKPKVLRVSVHPVCSWYDMSGTPVFDTQVGEGLWDPLALGRSLVLLLSACFTEWVVSTVIFSFALPSQNRKTKGRVHTLLCPYSSACWAIRASLYRGMRQRKKFHVWGAVEWNVWGMCGRGSLAVLAEKGHNVSLLCSNFRQGFPVKQPLRASWTHLGSLKFPLQRSTVLRLCAVQIALLLKIRKFHSKKALGNCTHVSLLSSVCKILE